MNENIRIGVDYHGVITEAPEFFRKFNRAAISKGFNVYVLSGGYRRDIEAYLRVHKIPYSHIWAMVDYFSEKKLINFLDDGSFRVDDDLWNQAKARYCLENHIDIHIDDSNLYGQHFATPFCLFKPQLGKCYIKGNLSDEINFNQKPEVVLDGLVNMVKKIRK